MKRAIIVFGLSILSCAPELGQTEAQRCDERSSCGDGAYCYRGFCLPSTSTADVPSDTESEEDAGLSDERVSIVDAGSSTPETGKHETLASVDAGWAAPAMPPRHTAEDAASTPALSVNDSGADGATAAVPPATVTPPTWTGTGAMPDAALGHDAGSAVDAGALADAATRGKPCSLEECCKEAQRAREKENDEKKNDDDEDDKQPGSNRACGCVEPELTRTLACSVLGPLGILL